MTQFSNQFTIQKIVGQTTASPSLNILDVQVKRPKAWDKLTAYPNATGTFVYNLFDRKPYETKAVASNLNKRPDISPTFWRDASEDEEFKTFVPGTPMQFDPIDSSTLIIVKLQLFSPLINRKLAAGVVIHDTKRQNRGIISPNSETSFRIASRGSVVYLKNNQNGAISRGDKVGYAPGFNPNLTTDPQITLFIEGADSPVGIALDQMLNGEIGRVLIMIPIIPKFGT